MKRRAWLIIAAIVAVVAYLMYRTKTTTVALGGAKTVDVDADAYARYVAGTASVNDIVKLGWPFAAEAALSQLSGLAGVQGPLVNGPDKRYWAGHYGSGGKNFPDTTSPAFTAVQKLDPDYNTKIDGYSAKLLYLNAKLAQYGRPKVYGFEDQSLPHSEPG